MISHDFITQLPISFIAFSIHLKYFLLFSSPGTLTAAAVSDPRAFYYVSFTAFPLWLLASHVTPPGRKASPTLPQCTLVKFKVIQAHDTISQHIRKWVVLSENQQKQAADLGLLRFQICGTVRYRSLNNGTWNFKKHLKWTIKRNFQE